MNKLIIAPWFLFCSIVPVACAAPVDETVAAEDSNLGSAPRLPAAGIECTFTRAYSQGGHEVSGGPLENVVVSVTETGRRTLNFEYRDRTSGERTLFHADASIHYGRLETGVPPFVSQWGDIAAVALTPAGSDWGMTFRPWQWRTPDHVFRVSFDCMGR